MENNANRLNEAEELVNMINKTSVKKVKRNDGLFERVEHENKIILTEDNRQIIFD